MFKNIFLWIGKNALYLALIQAIIATLGSLYFSNILDYPPCVLCWYQRIAMFPLVISLVTGILIRDKNTHLFVIPPALIGWAIAFYHCLLYYKIIPDTLAPCSTGVSCTTKYVEYFGFVTIPLLAFTAFSIILALMAFRIKFIKQENTN